jgi:hypothetical protein
MSIDIVPILPKDTIILKQKAKSIVLNKPDSLLGQDTMVLINQLGVYGFNSNKQALRICQQQRLYAMQTCKASDTYNMVSKLKLQNGDMAYSNDKIHIILKADKLDVLNDLTSLKTIVAELKTANANLFNALKALKVVDPISGQLPLDPSSITALDNIKIAYTNTFNKIDELIG